MKVKFNFNRLLNVGSILLLVATVLSLISLIIFSINVNGEGYFNGMGNSTVVLMSVLSLIFGLLASLITVIEGDEKITKILHVVQSALVMAMVCFLIIATLVFVEARVDGLGKILFSNSDLQTDVQTPENMASCKTAIVGIVFYAITWLVGVVASFFTFDKKEKVVATETAE